MDRAVDLRRRRIGMADGNMHVLAREFRDVLYGFREMRRQSDHPDQTIGSLLPSVEFCQARRPDMFPPMCTARTIRGTDIWPLHMDIRNCIGNEPFAPARLCNSPESCGNFLF